MASSIDTPADESSELTTAAAVIESFLPSECRILSLADQIDHLTQRLAEAAWALSVVARSTERTPETAHAAHAILSTAHTFSKVLWHEAQAKSPLFAGIAAHSEAVPMLYFDGSRAIVGGSPLIREYLTFMGLGKKRVPSAKTQRREGPRNVPKMAEWILTAGSRELELRGEMISPTGIPNNLVYHLSRIGLQSYEEIMPEDSPLRNLKKVPKGFLEPQYLELRTMLETGPPMIDQWKDWVISTFEQIYGEDPARDYPALFNRELGRVKVTKAKAERGLTKARWARELIRDGIKKRVESLLAKNPTSLHPPEK